MSDPSRSTHGVLSLKSLRASAAPLAKTALMRFGGYTAIRRVAPSRGVAILRYHAVCGPEGHRYVDPGISVTPAIFEQHVRYLTSEYPVLPLEDAVRALSQGQSLPPNAVAITFDDGYADNLGAARTLAKHGATATFYLTAGCLADGQPFWPSELRYLVAAIPAGRVAMHGGALKVEVDLTSDTARKAAVNQLTKVFKRHPIPVRESLREQLRHLAGHPVMPRVMLTWDEVREMKAMGMTIGAHTVTHPNLPNAGPADAWLEISGSKARLEAEVGAPVTMFSYPNGGAERYMTDDIARMVREAGFTAATTSWNGFARRQSDVFALERVHVAERLEDLVFALEVERFAFKPAPRAPQK
ncbi:MAG TPA: polysaccharide deacetylase family protein [Vicinamibacterales bacterium]|nr:polysaccharide deacetylase family protein [Vicinamibacterales bacterium]